MPRHLYEIMHNGYVKTYPDGSRDIYVAEGPIFRDKGFERVDVWEAEPRILLGEPRDKQDSVDRAKRRAKSRIKDLVLCNPFKYFVTFTLDKSKVDRYDVAAITKKLNTWLDNCVRRKGLIYVLVPELHKDGAVHFHGFINDALPVVDSGTLTKGDGKPRRPRSAAQRAEWLSQGARVVYNLPAWPLGFSTAIELYGDRRRAISYTCKYVVKALEKVGGRWYYSGGKLRWPQVAAFDADFEEVRAQAGEAAFYVDSLGGWMVFLHQEAGDYDAEIR